MNARVFATLRLALFICACAALAAALDRNAFTFTRYDLAATVAPASGTFSVTGTLRLRNESAVEQKNIALQISSSLEWQAIAVAGRPVQWLAQDYTTDIDHTGAVSEAVVTLAQPVAPGGEVELEIAYAGPIRRDAARLTRMGVPPAVAARSDWDRIEQNWLGLRGLGHVVWYPVGIEAASLSVGNEVFDAIAAWKARHAGSMLRVRLAAEMPGAAALGRNVNGEPCPLLPEEKSVGVYERDGRRFRQWCAVFTYAGLGGGEPTLLAGYTSLLGGGSNAQANLLPGSWPAAESYVAAIAAAQQALIPWFGEPKPVYLYQHPDLDAAAWESGAALVTAYQPAERRELTAALAHSAAHATFYSPRPWIAEGAAHLAEALVLEQQGGRAQALRYLGQHRRALVGAYQQPQAEQKDASASSRPQSRQPQPLVTTSDEIFLRSKSLFVWWMLRDMLGDAPLRAALAAYRPAEDKEPSYLQRLLEQHSKRSLETFFGDWVYRDRGLPDFRVAEVFPRQTLGDSYVVTVTVENLGEAGAEVPVVVRTAAGERSGRVLAPARDKGVVRVVVPVAPTEVVVNDGSVPEIDLSNNSHKVPPPARP